MEGGGSGSGSGAGSDGAAGETGFCGGGSYSSGEEGWACWAGGEVTCGTGGVVICGMFADGCLGLTIAAVLPVPQPEQAIAANSITSAMAITIALFNLHHQPVCRADFNMRS